MDPLIPGQAYPVAILLTDQPDPTLEKAPGSGVPGVYGYLSATRTGDAIAPALSLPGVESGTYTVGSGIAMVTSAKYLMEFLGPDTLALLPPYIGKQIWFRPFVGAQPMKAWPVMVVDAL